MSGAQTDAGVTEAAKVVEATLGVSVKFERQQHGGRRGIEELVDKTKREGSELWEDEEDEVLEARGESGQESKQVFY